MPDTNDLHSKKMFDIVHKSGLVDLKHLGDVVNQITPKLLDPGVVSDDYVAKVYSSVISVYKSNIEKAGLERITDLAKMGQQKPG